MGLNSGNCFIESGVDFIIIFRWRRMKGNLGSGTYHDDANSNRNTSDNEHVLLHEIKQCRGTVLQAKKTSMRYAHLYDTYFKRLLDTLL